MYSVIDKSLFQAQKVKGQSYVWTIEHQVHHNGMDMGINIFLALWAQRKECMQK